MFETVIESDADLIAKRGRRRYFVFSAALVGFLFTTAVVLSIYAGEYDIGDLSSETTLLSAPVPITADEPESLPAARSSTPSTARVTAMRTANVTENVARSTTIPVGISTIPNAAPTAPAGSYLIGPINRDAAPGDTGRENVSGPQNEISQRLPDKVEIKDEEIPKLPPARPARDIVRSKGVINGIARSLPKPAYSPIAIAARAQGEVKVQVTVDEAGKVISAAALEGHPTLRGPAVAAAKNARFSPTILNDTPIKVTGIIVYDFKLP